jgi:hypothetical protein
MSNPPPPPQSKLGEPVLTYERQFRDGIALAIDTFNGDMLRGWLSEIEEIAVCVYGADKRDEHLSLYATKYLEKKHRPWQEIDYRRPLRATFQKAHAQMMQYIKDYIAGKHFPNFDKTTQSKEWQFMQVLGTYGYFKKNLSGQKGDAFLCMLLADNTWDVYRILGLVVREDVKINAGYVTVLKRLAGPTTRAYLSEIYYNSDEDDAANVEGDSEDDEKETKRRRSDGLYCSTCHKQTTPSPLLKFQTMGAI